jgi:hypothetical protein
MPPTKGSRKTTAKRRSAPRCRCLFEPPILFAPDLSGVYLRHERECPLYPYTGIGNVPTRRERVRDKRGPGVDAPARIDPPARAGDGSLAPSSNGGRSSGRKPSVAQPQQRNKRARSRTRARHLRPVTSPRGEPPIESMLRAVEQVTDRAPRRAGEGRWMALCPAHDDRNPSLSIRETRDRVLIHCFAGCPTEAVLDALRLGWGDLFEAER